MSTEPNDIAVALRDQDVELLGDRLRGRRLAMLVSEVEGQRVPTVLTDADGKRSMAVFSGQDTFRLWGRPELLAMVPVEEIASVAARQHVDGVLVDPAGPAPAQFSPRQFQDIVDGVETSSGGEQRVTGPLDVRIPDRAAVAPLRAAVAQRRPEGVQAWVVERVVGLRRLTTVLAFGPSLAVADLAHSLSTDERVGAVDVISLDEGQLDFVTRQLDAARIR